MNIRTEKCEDCGTKESVCGDCGSNFVTKKDYIDGDVNHPHQSIEDAVLGADDGDKLTIVQVCWNCGAACERTLDVSVEHKPNDA